MNGVDRTPLNVSGIFVFNDFDVFGSGPVDGLFLLSLIGTFPSTNLQFPGTVQRLFIAALTGPIDTWDTVALPGDLNFLTKLTTRTALFSDEYPGGGDDNDILLGQGTLTITSARVPEPATLTLSALGIGALLARGRRSRPANN